MPAASCARRPLGGLPHGGPPAAEAWGGAGLATRAVLGTEVTHPPSSARRDPSRQVSEDVEVQEVSAAGEKKTHTAPTGGRLRIQHGCSGFGSSIGSGWEITF